MRPNNRFERKNERESIIFLFYLKEKMENDQNEITNRFEKFDRKFQN